MSVTTRVKNLVAQNKTKEALDMLQNFLKKRDVNLYNQTLLLESQYNEALKNNRLNLQDASTDLNRINFTLLSICDEASKLDDTEGGEYDEALDFNKKRDDKQKSGINPFVLFGVIVLLGLGIFWGVIHFLGNNTQQNTLPKPSQPVENQANTPTGKPAAKPVVSFKNWKSLSQIITVQAINMGQIRVKFNSVRYDINRKRLLIEATFLCNQTKSGQCETDQLQFSLTTVGRQILRPIDMPFSLPMNLQVSETKVLEFTLGEDITSAEFAVMFAGKPASVAKMTLVASD